MRTPADGGTEARCFDVVASASGQLIQHLENTCHSWSRVSPSRKGIEARLSTCWNPSLGL